MNSALPTITVQLWRADAVVLFDWLMRTDLDTVPVTHPAQKQALADLLSALEWRAHADITGSTDGEIAAAQGIMRHGPPVAAGLWLSTIGAAGASSPCLP
jgi:phage tail protein X